MSDKSKQISNKTLLWLLGEIESWGSEGLISSDQASQLKSRYKEQYQTQEQGRPDMMTIVISVIGALLVGLGVILFFAYNWDAIPRVVRMSTILVAMVSAYLGGYYIREKYPIYRQLGEAFIFLGAILFGSGIWLIAQMYNINSHYPNGFLFWALGAIAIAYTAESVPVNMLASVLLAIWTCTESFGFDHANLWYFPIVAIGIFPFVYQTKSRHALAVALISIIVGFFGSACGSFHSIALYIYTGLGSLIFLAGLAHYQKDSRNPFGKIYLEMSLRVLVVVLFISTFYDLHHEFTLHDKVIPQPAIWVLVGELVLGVALIYYNLKRIYYSDLLKDHWMYKICLGFPSMILLLAVITPFLLRTQTGETYALLAAIIWNMIFLGFAIALLYTGQQRNNMSLLYTGTLVLLLEAIGRYFDLFDSMLHRSVYFLLAGGLFIYYGFWLAKKRKAIQSIKKEVLS